MMPPAACLASQNHKFSISFHMPPFGNTAMGSPSFFFREFVSRTRQKTQVAPRERPAPKKNAIHIAL